MHTHSAAFYFGFADCDMKALYTNCLCNLSWFCGHELTKMLYKMSVIVIQRGTIICVSWFHIECINDTMTLVFAYKILVNGVCLCACYCNTFCASS